MKEQITLKQWIENFDNGVYDSNDINVQIDAGWYDWFCKDSSLKNKTKSLASKVKIISKSSKIDVNKTYVFFKNNCPCAGNKYDDFKICDIETDKVIYTIIPKSGHARNKGKSELWGKENNFEKEIVEGSWKDILNYFEV
jgi:hypothetical protein